MRPDSHAFLKDFISVIFTYESLCVRVHVGAFRGQKKGVSDSPAFGGTGDCELYSMGTRNRIQVL